MRTPAARTALAIAATALAVLAPSPASAYPAPGRTVRVSPLKADGTPVNADVQAISADGTKVLLYTAEPVLDTDTNGKYDLYLKDLVAGEIERASVTHDGKQPNDHCTTGDMSNDGTRVTFTCLASNMVPNDATPTSYDVYLRDLEAGTTSLVSVSSGGEPNNGTANWPRISADGCCVTFQSFATNLVPNDNNAGYWDIFVRDIDRGITEVVSVDTDERLGFFNPMYPTISGDGRYVAFQTRWGYDPRDTNAADDVYVRDRLAGTLERVSVATDGSQGDLHSINPSISDIGRYVAFASGASNFVENDHYVFAFDTFVHDLQTGVTERINVTPAGDEANGGMGTPSISADGRYVAGNVIAGDLGYDDSNGGTDVYVFDRLNRSAELISATPGGSAGNAISTAPRMTPDGRVIGFYSTASDLLGDGEGAGGSAYVRYRGPSLGAGSLEGARDGAGVRVRGWARFEGRPLVEVSDPGTDATPGAAAAAAELTGASVTYRPETGDLLFAVDRASRPHAGVPAVSVGAWQVLPNAVTYGVEFSVGGVLHEVRAVSGATAHTFALYRCQPGCAKVADLAGGIGTAGERVTASLPLTVLGLSGGDTLGAGRAYASAGEGTTGPQRVLDTVSIPSSTLPTTTLEVGVAPAGTPEDAVGFRAVSPSDGRFDETVPGAGTGLKAFARACLGADCRSSSVAVSE